MAEGARSSTDSEEIEDLANTMVQGLSYHNSTASLPDGNRNSCHIHKVHELVRQIDRFSYEPSVLSIGPYHNSTASLLMEKQKWRCLDYILKLNCTNTMQDYIVAISNMENQARACYSSEIKLDSKSFRRMLLLDGCFILVYLGGTHGFSRITNKQNPRPIIIPDDDVHGTGSAAQQSNRSPENMAEQKLDTGCEMKEVKVEAHNVVPWYHSFVMLDLFLLENQIPFFVVTQIHNILVGSAMEDTLTEKVSRFIEAKLQYLRGSGPYEKPKDICHLLHLCHLQFKPRMIHEESNHVRSQFGEYFVERLCNIFNSTCGHEEDEWNSLHDPQFKFLQAGRITRWRRATQYHDAGIIFKKKEFHRQNTHSLLNITFHDGVLEMPCLSIDDRTGPLFRNMIAFEQSNPNIGNFITSYVMFMSQLISRPDDVTLLSRRGIIVHLLHSDKIVSALFTRLTKGVVFDFMGNFYLKSVCWKMEMYYQSRINRWIAWLRHNHLSNPWLGLALFAGLLVLFCTIAQTVLIVLSYLGTP